MRSSATCSRPRGELAAAQATYAEHLAISGRLAEQDPSNAGWQRQLAVAHSRQRAAMTLKRLPIGIQAFRHIREEGCYYVDKTGFALRPSRRFELLLANGFDGMRTLFRAIYDSIPGG